MCRYNNKVKTLIICLFILSFAFNVYLLGEVLETRREVAEINSTRLADNQLIIDSFERIVKRSIDNRTAILTDITNLVNNVTEMTDAGVDLIKLKTR